MSWRRSSGMYSYRNTDNYSTPLWRVQVYWPELTIRRGEFHLMCRTTLRLVWKTDCVGFGVQLLGFGFGIAWDDKGVVVNVH